jgi:hypothetical protein
VRKAGVNSVTLCRPLPYGLHAAPLERGQRNPRKGYGRLYRTRTGRRRDVGLVERVPSTNSSPVRPSSLPYRHPKHYSTILGAVGSWDDKIPPRPLLCIRWPSVGRTLESAYGRRPDEKLPHDHPRSRSWVGTRLATMYGRGEIVRTTVNSAMLYTIPPYVA